MSTATGRAAEEAAAKYLKKLGHKIIARNWRTRWCEIDIVCSRKNTVYFVEVKYRKNPLHGDGLEYINATKLKQMHFAAEVWLAEKAAGNSNYRLAAIALGGSPPAVENWLDDI